MLIVIWQIMLISRVICSQNGGSICLFERRLILLNPENSYMNYFATENILHEFFKEILIQSCLSSQKKKKAIHNVKYKICYMN